MKFGALTLRVINVEDNPLLLISLSIAVPIMRHFKVVSGSSSLSTRCVDVS